MSLPAKAKEGKAKETNVELEREIERLESDKVTLAEQVGFSQALPYHTFKRAVGLLVIYSVS